MFEFEKRVNLLEEAKKWESNWDEIYSKMVGNTEEEVKEHSLDHDPYFELVRGC